MCIYISECMKISACRRIAIGDMDCAPSNTNMFCIYLFLTIFIKSVTDFCTISANCNSDQFAMYIADKSSSVRFNDTNPMTQFIENMGDIQELYECNCTLSASPATQKLSINPCGFANVNLHLKMYIYILD
eukprot:224014_1